jgi:hypothetical protein
MSRLSSMFIRNPLRNPTTEIPMPEFGTSNV